MNQIIVEGNVVRDSQIKETPRGTRVCVVPIATNHFYRNAGGALQKDVTYLDVEAWGQKFCESIVSNARKGRALRVVGRLKQDRWKNQDGKNSSKTYIIAEHIDFPPVKDSQKAASDEKAQAEIAAEGLQNESGSFEADEGSFIDEGETVF